MSYTLAGETIATLREEIASEKVPIVYECGIFTRMEIGPGKIILIGSPPGYGKTSLIGQLMFDALYAQPELRAVVCNVEMTPIEIMERELARVSGVTYDIIQHRKLPTDEIKQKVETSYSVLQKIETRLGFVQPPFCLAETLKTADEMNADLIVIDYIQRVPISHDTAQHQDIRLQLNESITLLRQAANQCGKAIIVLSSVGRGKDGNYKNVGLGGYKESSELEFGANNAYVLQRPNPDDGFRLLEDLKGRKLKRQNFPLRLTGEFQRWEHAGYDGR